MNLDQFVDAYNNKIVDVDGAYGGQCWDLVAEYSRSVIGVPPHDSFPYGLPTGDGCAAGVFKNFPDPLPQYYDRIANNPNDPNQVPQRGDIIVWDYSSPGSGGAGHIAIVLSADTNGFTSLDQNWVPQITKQINHNYNYIQGWLRPKGEDMVDGKTAQQWKDFWQQDIDTHNAKIADLQKQLDDATNALNQVEQIADTRFQQEKKITDALGLTSSPDDIPSILQAVNNIKSSMQSQIDSLNQKVNEIAKANDILTSTNKDLEAKLAVRSQDTSQLNSLGAALTWLITRLGINKKG